jgi:hypothetical protein
MNIHEYAVETTKPASAQKTDPTEDAIPYLSTAPAENRVPEGIQPNWNPRSGAIRSCLAVAATAISGRATSSFSRAGCFLICAAALCVAQPPANPVQFSADVVWEDHDAMEPTQFKAYFGDRRIRVEAPTSKGKSIAIVTLRQNTKKVYFVVGWGYNQGSEEALGASQWWHLVRIRLGGPLQDPANPCAEMGSWFVPDDKGEREKDLPKLKTCSRTSASPQLVNGRETEVWDIRFGGPEKPLEEERFTGYVDPVLKHFLRLEFYQDGGDRLVIQELRNIKIGPQPASLFDVPARVNPAR